VCFKKLEEYGNELRDSYKKKQWRPPSKKRKREEKT
jgi:hypothetical protein